MLMMLGAVGLTRPVLAATPDFTISTNPSRVTIPLGYWAETMLTLTSLNGFEGTIQLDAPIGSSTGLAGAGFSTGMTLGPNGSVSTDHGRLVRHRGANTKNDPVRNLHRNNHRV